MSESYKTIPPIKSDYTPVGTIEKIGGLNAYVSKPKNNSKPFKKAVIICYDIFGISQNIQQYCDILAETGFLVVLPDYLHGQAWSLSRVQTEG